MAQTDSLMLVNQNAPAAWAREFETRFGPLPAGGRVVQCTANSPVDGDRPDRVWIVLKGPVDLFAVRRDDGEGARHPLFTVPEGGVIFGIPASASRESVAPDGPAERVHVMFAGFADSEVYEIGAEQLFADVTASVAERIEAWVTALSSALLEPADPWPVRVAEQAGYQALAEREVLHGHPRELFWVRKLEGMLFWQGQDVLPLDRDESLPLVGALSVVAESKADIFLETTLTLAADGRLRDALAPLMHLASQRLRDLVAEREGDERARILRRLEGEQAVRRATFLRAASILSDASALPSDGIVPGEPPLAAAFRMVATNGGARLGPLEALPPDTPVIDHIQAMARLNGLRARRVLLRGTWWRTDIGALLAFRGEDRDPVALLPDGPRRACLIDPAAGTRQRITEAEAAELSGDAVALYQALPSRPVRFRNLIGLAGGPALGDLTMVFAIGLLVACLALATPVVTGYLIDSVIPRAEYSRVAEATLALLALALGAAALRAVQAIGLVRAEGRVDWKGQSALFNRLLSLPTGFFRGYTVGDLADRCLGLQRIRTILTGNVLQAVLQGVFSVVSFALLFVYSWRLALVASAVVAVIAVVLLAFTAAQRTAQAEIVRYQGLIDGLTVQLLTAVGKLRVAAAETRALARWLGLVVEQKERQRRVLFWSNLVATLNSAVPVVASGFLFVGITMILSDARQEVALAALLPLVDGETDPAENVMTTGDFLAFNAAFAQFMTGFLGLALSLSSLIEIGPLVERARPILTAVPESYGGRTAPGHLSGAIDIRHVSFRYDKDGPPILKDFSLSIAEGSFVAIVGPSGSGKSTLMRLLLGFEAPESGNIFYDGKPLDQLDAGAVRSQIGVVLQNGRLNPGSIAGNIIGASGATLADAWTAARLAGLAPDIQAMPMGMHTMLVEGAQTLSGGQRQRLMLARALVHRPRLLILDEATSALDNRTQAIVSDSLMRLHNTRIVIAHRLSTIVNADCIVVVEDGRLVETGSYDELIDAGGSFSALARRQLN